MQIKIFCLFFIFTLLINYFVYSQISDNECISNIELNSPLSLVSPNLPESNNSVSKNTTYLFEEELTYTGNCIGKLNYKVTIENKQSKFTLITDSLLIDSTLSNNLYRLSSWFIISDTIPCGKYDVRLFISFNQNNYHELNYGDSIAKANIVDPKNLSSLVVEVKNFPDTINQMYVKQPYSITVTNTGQDTCFFNLGQMIDFFNNPVCDSVVLAPAEKKTFELNLIFTDNENKRIIYTAQIPGTQEFAIINPNGFSYPLIINNNYYENIGIEDFKIQTEYYSNYYSDIFSTVPYTVEINIENYGNKPIEGYIKGYLINRENLSVIDSFYNDEKLKIGIIQSIKTKFSNNQVITSNHYVIFVFTFSEDGKIFRPIEFQDIPDFDYMLINYIFIYSKPPTPDIYEPNDTKTTAWTITPQFTDDNYTFLSDSINKHYNSDDDYFRISLEANYNYHLKLSGIDSLNHCYFRIYLYYGSWIELESNNYVDTIFEFDYDQGEDIIFYCYPSNYYDSINFNFRLELQRFPISTKINEISMQNIDNHENIRITNIYNLSGQKVLSQPFNNQNINNTLINNNLTPGVYIIEYIDNNNNIISRKKIIL